MYVVFDGLEIIYNNYIFVEYSDKQLVLFICESEQVTEFYTQRG